MCSLQNVFVFMALFIFFLSVPNSLLFSPWDLHFLSFSREVFIPSVRDYTRSEMDVFLYTVSLKSHPLTIWHLTSSSAAISLWLLPIRSASKPTIPYQISPVETFLDCSSFDLHDNWNLRAFYYRFHGNCHFRRVTFPCEWSGWWTINAISTES